MPLMQIIVIALLVVTLVAGVGWAVMTLPSGRQREIRGMMSNMSATPAGNAQRINRADDGSIMDIEQIKRLSGSSRVRKTTVDSETKLFKAGIFSAQSRQRYKTAQYVLPIAVPLVLYAASALYLDTNIALLFGGIGIFIGLVAPGAWLDRAIRLREEDIMYFLPLVIEQVSIGVSSALDVGPCISHIVAMANERDSHNPVTEMFVHVEKLIRSGLNLEDALFDVGDVSGMSEVKHAFMFLGQCAKHGGEVSRQLQELADAVTVQRQVTVEGRITALPVKATGPLALVFAGFFGFILAGLFVKMLGVFSAG